MRGLRPGLHEVLLVRLLHEYLAGCTRMEYTPGGYIPQLQALQVMPCCHDELPQSTVAFLGHLHHRRHCSAARLHGSQSPDKPSAPRLAFTPVCLSVGRAVLSQEALSMTGTQGHGRNTCHPGEFTA